MRSAREAVQNSGAALISCRHELRASTTTMSVSCMDCYSPRSRRGHRSRFGHAGLGDGKIAARRPSRRRSIDPRVGWANDDAAQRRDHPELACRANGRTHVALTDDKVCGLKNSEMAPGFANALSVAPLRIPCGTMTSTTWCSALPSQKTRKPLPSASVASDCRRRRAQVALGEKRPRSYAQELRWAKGDDRGQVRSIMLGLS